MQAARRLSRSGCQRGISFAQQAGCEASPGSAEGLSPEAGALVTRQHLHTQSFKPSLVRKGLH